MLARAEPIRPAAALARDIAPGELLSVLHKLLSYCRVNEWAGYDPYDALNSKLFELFPALDRRVPRLVLTQALKRSPINFRPVLLVPKSRNAKAIALFLSAFVRLSHRQPRLVEQGLVSTMIEQLAEMRSPESDQWCWGYSFPWQTRTRLVPKGAPNLVCTYFAASALLDAFEAGKDARLLTMAIGAADFVLSDLYRQQNGRAWFAYPLRDSHATVHNANFLGAALLCRVHALSGEQRFLQPALNVARYSATRQARDGSWPYGEGDHQDWRDNFHTGFNLCGLRSIANSVQTSEFDECIRRGFEFYRDRFFRKDGAPRYFDRRTYPIDTHSVAQSIITLVTLRDLDDSAIALATGVCSWAIRNMWSDGRGHFIYRALPLVKIRTSYMRWSQAWMLLALAVLVEHLDAGRTESAIGADAA